MQKNFLYAIVGIIVVAIAAAAFYSYSGRTGSNSYNQPSQNLPIIKPNQTGTSNGQSSTNNQTSPTTETFSVSEKEYSFTPSTISVKRGDTVSITVTNDGTTLHNLYIEGYNVGTKNLSPGQSQTIIFGATQSGNFTFKCTIDSHAELGLTGTLVVS